MYILTRIKPFVILVLLSFQTQQTFANEWRAGAVRVLGEVRGAGQGYIVQNNHKVYLYTIRHVLDKVSPTALVVIPGLTVTYRVSTNQFRCEPLNADGDAGCYFLFAETEKKEILDTGLTPLQTTAC